jgi:hypothetical protein
MIIKLIALLLSVITINVFAQNGNVQDQSYIITVTTKDSVQTQHFSVEPNPYVSSKQSIFLDPNVTIVSMGETTTEEKYINYRHYEPWYCFGDVFCDANTSNTHDTVRSGLSFAIGKDKDTNLILVKGVLSEVLSIDGHWQLFEGAVYSTPNATHDTFNFRFPNITKQSHCTKNDTVEVCIKPFQG